MCELCSADKNTREIAEGVHLMVARNLERLAEGYRRLASHEINPHSEATKGVGDLAKSVIRTLVDDWV